MSEKDVNPSILQQCYLTVRNLSFRTHLLISLILRLILIVYGQWHDSHSAVPYTDIDYKVVTDGARQLLQGRSPFLRHTYRYSPLLAYLQLPSILIHPAAGKCIYASFDLLLAIIIYSLVRSQLQLQRRRAIYTLLHKFGGATQLRHKQEAEQQVHGDVRLERLAIFAAACWLYNPLTAVISTRGNGDSFSSFFVLLTIYLLLQAEQQPQRQYCLIFAAGLSHGFAIHLRLYPLLFSLAFYLSLNCRFVCRVSDVLRLVLLPNKRQLLLVFGTLLSLLLFSSYFYASYGWQYVYEAYLYHFVRRDVRHNFSLYFLMQYLNDGQVSVNLLEKLLVMLPQLLLLLYLSFTFGQFMQTLPFCIFTLSFVLVTFNSVVTSQYFVWYLSLLPLCLNNLSTISLARACFYVSIWLLTQALWLLPAYLLEFRTWNTFLWIGIQGAIFFLANCYLLMQLIQHYSFTSFKINFKKLF